MISMFFSNYMNTNKSINQFNHSTSEDGFGPILTVLLCRLFFLNIITQSDKITSSTRSSYLNLNFLVSFLFLKKYFSNSLNTSKSINQSIDQPFNQ